MQMCLKRLQKNDIMLSDMEIKKKCMDKRQRWESQIIIGAHMDISIVYRQ